MAPKSTVVKVERFKVGTSEHPPTDKADILRIQFGEEGPVVFLTAQIEQMLRSEHGAQFRTIIEDTLKAVFDQIMVH